MGENWRELESGMTDEKPKDWVAQTLNKFVVDKSPTTSRPLVGRNLQVEVSKIRSVTNTVLKYRIPPGELARLRNEIKTLMNVLDAQ